MAIDPKWVRENPEEAARQIELLTIERDQYRAAEEAQIALREKAALRVEELECQVEEAGRYLRDTARRDALIKAECLERFINVYLKPGLACNRAKGELVTLIRQCQGGE
jgi:hypothetical protein